MTVVPVEADVHGSTGAPGGGVHGFSAQGEASIR